MNTSKSNSYMKLLVFFLIAIILIFAFGLVADGWQSDTKSEPDSGEIDGNDDQSDEADENKDGTSNSSQENEIPAEPEIYIPEYVNALTGLETSESIARRRPTAFVMSTAAPMYGLSGADLIAEFPTEDGSTRLLMITSETTSLGKIGSLSPTKGYISNLAKNFAATLVSNGCDDTKVYESADITGAHFDLSINPGYHYTEYTHFVYTNGDLINAGLANANIGTVSGTKQTLPYIFNEFGNENIIGDSEAKTVILPFSETSETELYYSEADEKYAYAKSGLIKRDMLNDKTIGFDNVFVLFADTITYERAEGSTLVMNTIGTGAGYYMTHGTAIKINWTADATGNMNFTTEGGEPLVVNRGNSYIGFVKSSKTNDVKIS